MTAKMVLPAQLSRSLKLRFQEPQSAIPLAIVAASAYVVGRDRVRAGG
jgi:hypothetical protein